MPDSSTEDSVALDGFQNDEGRDEAGKEEAERNKEATVASPDISVNYNEEVEINFRTFKPRNQFSDKRNFVRQLCDASLLAASASQLRAVLDNGSGNTYFIPLLIMIAMSIVFHVVFGFLMIQRWRYEREAQKIHKTNNGIAITPQSQVRAANPEGELCFCAPCKNVERYDEISMYFVFLVVILNVVIAGLGLSGPKTVSP